MAENKLKIFDSLAHPVLDDAYSPYNRDYSFKSLELAMKESSVKWACAVGLYGKGSYDHKAYIDKCNSIPGLHAIAAFNPQESNNIAEDLKEIKELGFKAIKIHPGICNLDINSSETFTCFEECSKLELPIFLCSYYYSQETNSNFYEKLYKLISKFPKQKLNIVHGGAVELLKFAEMVRANENIILDLSFTILKYSGSSIDTDIKFLFENFDRRICVGTDHPEFSPRQLEEKLKILTKGLAQEKIDNICHKNLAKFLNLEFDL